METLFSFGLYLFKQFRFWESLSRKTNGSRKKVGIISELLIKSICEHCMSNHLSDWGEKK